MAIFLLFPTQNYYAKLKIPLNKPVIRSVEIKLPPPPLYPVNIIAKPKPLLTASSVMVVDVPGKTIIWAKNPDKRLLPASTTKIMTALVALDKWQLDDILEVKNNYQIGQTMGLIVNEKMTLENLLYGLLVDSANDAAYVLADNYPGGLAGFVTQMNKKTRELNLYQTHFMNPAGIEQANHFTTAHDLAILASSAMENKIFSRTVGTPKIRITDVSGKNEYILENINQLIGKVPGVKGVKTGWTENAGECLITDVKREKGEIIIVILHSQDRFGETKKIINWVFNNFEWQPIDASHQ